VKTPIAPPHRRDAQRRPQPAEAAHPQLIPALGPGALSAPVRQQARRAKKERLGQLHPRTTPRQQPAKVVPGQQADKLAE
jgi:hypothetical protein